MTTKAPAREDFVLFASTDKPPGCGPGSGTSASNIWDKPATNTGADDEWDDIGGEISDSNNLPGGEAWKCGGGVGDDWSPNKDDGWESSEKIGGDGFGGNRWGNIGRVSGTGSSDGWGAPSSTIWGNSGGCDVWGSSSNVGGIKWGSVGKDGDGWVAANSGESLTGCSKVVGDNWGSTSNTRSGQYGWGNVESEENEWGNVSKQAWSHVRRDDEQQAKVSQVATLDKDSP